MMSTDFGEIDRFAVIGSAVTTFFFGVSAFFDAPSFSGVTVFFVLERDVLAVIRVTVGVSFFFVAT